MLKNMFLKKQYAFALYYENIAAKRRNFFGVFFSGKNAENPKFLTKRKSEANFGDRRQGGSQISSEKKNYNVGS